MLSLIDLINGLMTTVFALILWPFRGMNPVWAVILVSLASGLFMLWVFAITSNQDGIRESKDKVRGNLLGVRLFQHDVGVVMRLQGAIFRETLHYLRHSLTPVLVLLLPVLLILIQLNLFFSNRPLNSGETSLLTITLNGISVMDPTVQLVPSTSFSVETSPVRVEGKKEISWRIKALKEGTHQIHLKVGEETFEKELAVGQDWRAVSPVRTNDWVELLLYSGEPSFSADSQVTSIRLVHSPLQLSLVGFSLDWLVLFFALSVLSAFAFKGWLGVEL